MRGNLQEKRMIPISIVSRGEYGIEHLLRFGLPPSVSCFGLAADCLQSYYPISHASSMRRRRTWPTCLYLVCIFTCIVFPPSGHSTLPIVSLTWPLSFSVYFPSFSLLSDSLYFRPATFPPPELSWEWLSPLKPQKTISTAPSP